jgi:hypothetical protein
MTAPRPSQRSVPARRTVWASKPTLAHTPHRRAGTDPKLQFFTHSPKIDEDCG